LPPAIRPPVSVFIAKTKDPDRWRCSFQGKHRPYRPPGGDHETLLKSIREKLFVLPDDVTVVPGAWMPTTIGYEKTHNPFLI
jgi:glyoxylase-like metal-dependent hydrolase (beta-lactamase superfamily II)